ncbi:MAG: DMT family transporter [Acidobacteria bacterium]|nr:DMT family transporter [Acidobacteriota bacterium]HMU33800.1 DMT family transporter [Pyrinomonadaceae bacterium]
MPALYFLIVLALLAGAVLPTQTALNNKLAVTVDNPILAALLSFIVGTITIAIYSVATGVPLGNIAAAKNAPPTAWLGGVLGAFFVASTVILLPRLGVAMTFGLVVAGQMLITLFYDHFGLLGLDVKPMNFGRVIGVLLVIGGVILIRRF